MYKILVIMKNNTNGITSEVLEFDSLEYLNKAFLILAPKMSDSYSAVIEVIKLF